jgi:metal-responsive CopG/Arc/MetJ family transcriptional regulator
MGRSGINERSGNPLLIPTSFRLFADQIERIDVIVKEKRLFFSRSECVRHICASVILEVDTNFDSYFGRVQSNWSGSKWIGRGDRKNYLFSVKLPDGLKKLIDDKAKEVGKNRGCLVKCMLDFYFNEYKSALK